MIFEAVTPMHHLMIMGSSVASGPLAAEARLAVIATLSKGYDLDYIWKQVDQGPAKDAAGYYIQAAETGGEPPGRWWGPGAQALGFEPGQIVERKPYDLLFGEHKAPDGTRSGQAARQRPQGRRHLHPAAGRRAARHRGTQARTAAWKRPARPGRARCSST